MVVNRNPQAVEKDTLRAQSHPNNESDWAMYNQIDLDFKSAYIAVQQLGLHRKWGIYDDYWASKQNVPENEEDPGSVTNIVHPVIESQVADLVDEPVDFMIKGVEPSDEMWAKYAQFVCEWIWDQNKMAAKMDRFERIRLKYGTGVWKVYYDPFGNRSSGSICIDPVGPEKMYIDPKVTDPMKIQDSDFIIQVSDVSLRWLVRRFGKRAKYVRPRTNSRYQSNIFAGENIKDASSQASTTSVTLIEYWVKDEDGLLRLIYMADDVILWDSRWNAKKQKAEGLEYWNPDESFYENGKYPFVFVPCYLREGQVWGMGDVELLQPVQDMINDLDDQIRINARLMGNIQVVVGLASGINPQKWTNKPGLRVPARDHTAWQMVQPTGLPSYIMDRRELGKREAELISGRTDVTEGRKPGGVKAASAIIALQEAGNRRVNHKKLMSQVGLSEVVVMSFEHFTSFFTEQMAIRVTGEKQNEPDQFAWMKGSDFNQIPQMVPDTAQPTDANGLHPLTQLEEVKYNKDGSTTRTPQTKRAEFDFSVKMGSGLPRNKSFLYQAGLELHREQVLTTEEARQFFKDMLDWPLIDPFNPVGVYSNNKPELGPDGHPIQPPQPPGQPGMGGGPGQPGGAPGMTQMPQGMNPQLMQQLSGMLGGQG